MRPTTVRRSALGGRWAAAVGIGALALAAVLAVATQPSASGQHMAPGTVSHGAVGAASR